MNILVIGGSFAGITAALSARDTYPEAQITLLEKKEELGFIPGALNLILNDQMKALEDAFFITLAKLAAAKVTVQLGAEVTEIQPDRKMINYWQQGELQQVAYSQLILATGSRQVSEGIVGINSAKIITYKSIAEAQAGLDLIKQSQKIVVIGAGQVGMEMASSLSRLNKEVMLIESMAYPLAKYFDEEMLEPIMAAMPVGGVTFKPNQTVAQVEETESGLLVETQKETIACDSAVFALSVRPNLGYLKGQLARHANGSLRVNEYLQTSDPAIFAIGDAIQVPSSLGSETTYVPLVNNAIRTGRVVAANLKSQQVKFSGSHRTLGTQLFGYYLASTGLTEAESVFYADDIAVNHVTQPPSLSNSAGEIKAKLVYNQRTERVLGAQLVSKTPILEKINTLALGIQLGVTLKELAQKDYFYQPAWNNLFDITNQLGLMKE